MHAVIVNIQIKPEFADAFADAAREHGSHSVKEHGCLRFDVLRFQDDPNHFMYLEVFQNEEVSQTHSQSARTLAFREKTGPWRAQTNVPQRVNLLTPEELS